VSITALKATGNTSTSKQEHASLSVMSW